MTFWLKINKNSLSNTRDKIQCLICFMFESHSPCKVSILFGIFETNHLHEAPHVAFFFSQANQSLIPTKSSEDSNPFSFIGPKILSRVTSLLPKSGTLASQPKP